MKCKSETICPIPSVHQRLSDAHRHWHQVVENYHDPISFRINLNSCIQTLRNVTFILQKQKSIIPGFRVWYSGWQDKMKNDPILKWLVQARNRIVKEGDLQTKSYIKVSIVASYYEPPYKEFLINPLTPTIDIIDQLHLGNIPNHYINHGLLKVERLWIVKEFPDIDLVKLLSHTYGFLSTLVDNAHNQAGVLGSNIYYENSNGNSLPYRGNISNLDGKLPCMIDTTEYSTIFIKIKTGEIICFELIDLNHNKDIDEIAKSRYDIQFNNSDKSDSDLTENLHEIAMYFMKIAIKIIKKDGHHISLAFLIPPSGAPLIIGIKPNDRSEKYLVWSNLANEVKKYGADKIIFITESWIAKFDPSNPEVFPSDSPDKFEELSLCAASINGEKIFLHSRISKHNDKVVLGDIKIDQDSSMNFLEPVFRAWEKMK